MVVAGGRVEGELVFHGYRVSVWEDENILEVDGGMMVAQQCECT